MQQEREIQSLTLDIASQKLDTVKTTSHKRKCEHRPSGFRSHNIYDWTSDATVAHDARYKGIRDGNCRQFA